MAFKLSNPPYDTNNVPVYNVPMEDDVMGKANNNGTIILNNKLDPSECEKVNKNKLKVTLTGSSNMVLHYKRKQ